MQKHTFSYGGTRNIGSIACDPTQIKGRGSVLTPTLMVPVKLEMLSLGETGATRTGILFQALSGRVIVAHAGGFTLRMERHSIQRTIMQGPAEQNIDLEFPISQHQVEAVEGTRDSGDVTLDLQINVEFLVLAQAISGVPPGAIPPRAVIDAGVTPVLVHVVVPRSVWAKDVLPQLGFGTILLFEFPALPVSALAALGESFEATKRAQAVFNAGEYDLSVGLCRTAVQPLRNHLKKIKAVAGSDTAADWTEKIGAETFVWLESVLGKTHGMGSAALHEGSPGRFSRLDAQMILTITISVLAYAARLERTVRP